jgi:hypothetical protein
MGSTAMTIIVTYASSALHSAAVGVMVDQQLW